MTLNRSSATQARAGNIPSVTADNAPKTGTSHRVLNSHTVLALAIAMVLMVTSYLFFTFHSEPNNIATALGYLYMALAILFIYQGMFLAGLRTPVDRLRQTQCNIKEGVYLHQASHDLLTGLPNRHQLRERLDHAIACAACKGGGVAVMLLGLDRFKNVNNTLGHDIGDQLLQQVAQRIKAVVSDDDVVARLGGDEFIVLLKNGEQREGVVTAVNSLLAALSDPVTVNGRDLPLAASIGIALYPKDGHDAPTLLCNADTAMYQAKGAGCGPYRFYDAGMNAHVGARLDMEVNLKRAHLRSEFSLSYQPKVNLHNGAITGVEALLRWRSPTRGMVPPGEFIPILEESGLIHEVSAWLFAEVGATLTRWRALGIGVPVAINISAQQFQQEGGLELLRRQISDSGMDARMLQLEITESLIIADPELAIRELESVRELGVTIAMDDFGTGYSSLSYLKRLPLDVLKIDGCFVRGLPDDHEDAAITRTIIGLGKALGMRVVAEQVETAAQANFLLDQGCDEMQGYLFSPPVQLEALEQMLIDGREAPWSAPITPCKEILNGDSFPAYSRSQ
jgi:diguanylate cyclase (GGDEF)-like protein